ncbi:transposase [Streptomyces sp. NPDC057428]|uniref:transposase n=1 Tax=Streptomyces sp. NPDC057428 TaxID=3346129 RepID=UPI00367B1EF5
MSDAEWAVTRDALPDPGWLRGKGGQPEGYCHRQMLDAIRYLVDNGIKWGPHMVRSARATAELDADLVLS